MSSSEKYTKKKEFIDINLFSGSSENFRAAAGRSWKYVSSSEGESCEFGAGWQEKDELLENAVAFGSLMTFVTDPDLRERIRGNYVVPSYRIPVRTWGNKELITNDTHWKTIMLGGTYNTSSYRGFWADNIFRDSYMTYDYPYTAYEQNVILNTGWSDSSMETINISYDYNFYIKEYEEHYTSTIPRERQMPNLYFISMMQNADDEELETFPKDLVSLISRDGAYEEVVSVTSL